MSTASANEPAASAWREHASAPAFARGEVGVLLFLAGEVMFFAGLVAAALVLRSADTGWHTARSALVLPPALAGTALLVVSSVVLELGLRRGRGGNASALRATLLTSALLGAAFVALQGFEYRTLLAHGLRWTSGVFGSCFYVLTALHALHVCAGVAWLALVACTAGPRVERATSASWYWHLVGAVWIGLFLLFYVA